MSDDNTPATIAAFLRLSDAEKHDTLQQFGPERAAAFLASMRAMGRNLTAADDLIVYAQRMNAAFTAPSHIRQIAQRLPRGKGEGKRVIIVMPPRHGKSELVSRTLPAFLLGRDPTMQIIATSYGQELPTGFGKRIRALLLSEQHQAVFPGCILSKDSTAADSFATTQGGNYLARGIGGGITGYGADVAIVDDPVRSAADVESQTLRDSTFEWYQSVFLTRLMPHGSVVIVSTRWHHDDLVGRVLAMNPDGWDVLHLPAIDEDTGAALWPEQYNLAQLEAKRKEVGARAWNASYQGNPTPDTGDYFKRDWFRFYDVRELPSPLPLYVSLDLAYSASKDADRTAICVFGVAHDGQIYVVDFWCGRGTLNDTLAQLVGYMRRYTVVGVVMEGDPGTRAVLQMVKDALLKANVYRPIREVSAAGDKAAKCRATQGLIEAGHIRFPATARATWWPPLESELLQFPAGKHDDQVDAISLIGRMVGKFAAAGAPRAAPPPLRPDSGYYTEQVQPDGTSTYAPSTAQRPTVVATGAGLDPEALAAAKAELVELRLKAHAEGLHVPDAAAAAAAAPSTDGAPTLRYGQSLDDMWDAAEPRRAWRGRR